MKCMSCNSEMLVEKFKSYNKYVCRDNSFIMGDIYSPCNSIIVFDNILNRLIHYTVKLTLNDKKYALTSSRDEKSLSNHEYSTLSCGYGPNSHILTIKRFINPNNPFKLKDYKDIVIKLLNLQVFS